MTLHDCAQLIKCMSSVQCRYYNRNSQRCIKVINAIRILVHVLWSLLFILDIYFINFYTTTHFPFFSSQLYILFFVVSLIISVGYFFGQKEFQKCSILFCSCILDDFDDIDLVSQSKCLYLPFLIFMLITFTIYPLSPSLYYHIISTLYIRQYQWYSNFLNSKKK